ncbi:uncharacterized protein LOC143363006 [Halictus rubicundus]|uniref:uncharacterized protein LOC143363006 n=1 Tax=Halictus rubicundus TaxID=77578 RepID=UPI0040357B08
MVDVWHLYISERFANGALTIPIVKGVRSTMERVQSDRFRAESSRVPYTHRVTDSSDSRVFTTPMRVAHGLWYKSLENRPESCSSRLAALNTVMGKMRFKVAIASIVALAVARRSRAGVISLEGEAFDEQPASLDGTAEQHQLSLASSYVQFHGPVEGPEYQVKVPQQHDDGNHLHGQGHDYTVDYVAHPRYEFSYGVEDHHTGDFHTQKETRDGSSVSGEYSVKEPGGQVRVVRYRADKDGFHAAVHTSGENDHTTGVYGGQGQTRVHDRQPAEHQEQDVHDYATSYVNHHAY